MISVNSSTLVLPPISPAGHHRRRPRITARASQGDNNSNYYASGKLVDESMIVLRKRIHEMKMAEQSHDPPADWLAWEKRCFSDYDSHICEALGYLQSHLMNTRPSVTFGMLALLTLSLPLSSAVLIHRFFQIAAALIAGIFP